MELLGSILLALLAVLIVVGVVMILVWIENGVNKANKKVDDKWREMERLNHKDIPR